MTPPRSLLVAALLAALLGACTSDVSGDGAMGGGGGDDGGGDGAACVIPDGGVPAVRLLGPDGEKVAGVTGVVVDSPEGQLVIDSCLLDDCTPSLHLLKRGFEPTSTAWLPIPAGTLVAVTVETPVSKPTGPIHSGAGDTVRVVNLPSVGGVTNPVATDDRPWLYRSDEYLCGVAKSGIDARFVEACEVPDQPLAVYELELETDDGTVHLAPGDLAGGTFDGIPYQVEFGGYHNAGESGSCRWMVTRTAP